tara:strand:- start:2282 stop:2677 length:396 start_codon:yes stop_codon:yes gene_type:complete
MAHNLTIDARRPSHGGHPQPGFALWLVPDKHGHLMLRFHAFKILCIGRSEGRADGVPKILTGGRLRVLHQRLKSTEAAVIKIGQCTHALAEDRALELKRFGIADGRLSQRQVISYIDQADVTSGMVGNCVR